MGTLVLGTNVDKDIRRQRHAVSLTHEALTSTVSEHAPFTELPITRDRSKSRRNRKDFSYFYLGSPEVANILHKLSSYLYLF